MIFDDFTTAKEWLTARGYKTNQDYPPRSDGYWYWSKDGEDQICLIKRLPLEWVFALIISNYKK